MVSAVAANLSSVHSLNLASSSKAAEATFVDVASVTCEVAQDAANVVVEAKVEELTPSQIAAELAQKAALILPTDIKV